MSKYGDLERHLGEKYAKDLGALKELHEARSNCDDLLNRSMNVLAMLSKANIVIQQSQIQQQTAGR